MLGQLERSMTPTLDAALLSRSRAGAASGPVHTIPTVTYMVMQIFLSV